MTATPAPDGVALDPSASLPQRVTVRRGARTFDVVVLAAPADVPALRGAAGDGRGTRVELTVPEPATPLARRGLPIVLGPVRTTLAADLVAVTVAVRCQGGVAWARTVRPGQVHPVVVDGEWVADLHVLAADLPFGALTGTVGIGDSLRLALAWEPGGRGSLAPPAVHQEGGPFDALA